MRVLLLNSASGSFATSPAVVIFFFWNVSVASLFLDMRDLLLGTASGRFAPSPAVVIFYLRNASVALNFHDSV